MLKKRRKYSGKSQILFPVFFFLFTNIIHAGWNDFPNIISGLYTAPDFQQNSIPNQLSVAVFYQIDDIYRKKISGTITGAISQESAGFSIRFPYRLGKSSQVFSLLTTLPNSKADNLNDETAVQYKLANKGLDSKINWLATDGKGILSVGIRHTNNSYNADLEIMEFPDSDDPRINQYFLDFLPSAIGNLVNFSTQSKSFDFSILGSTEIVGRQIGLSLNHFSSENNACFNYINSSNRTDLRGARRLDTPTTVRQNRVAFYIDSPIEVLSSASLILFDTKIAATSDLQSYDAIDMDDLGELELARTGLSLQANALFFNSHVRLGVSAIDYSGRFNIKTPLLGYAADPIFGLEILPVAHAAEGRLGKSRSFAQLLGWSRDFHFGHTSLQIAADYIHARYNFHIQGEAQLEFGLASSPIDYPVILDADMFDLTGGIHYNFEHFSLEYHGQQIIPLFNRIDDSPVRFHKPSDQVKVQESGGQTHRFVLAYHF